VVGNHAMHGTLDPDQLDFLHLCTRLLGRLCSHVTALPASMQWLGAHPGMYT